jgi:hypothetical protein
MAPVTNSHPVVDPKDVLDTVEEILRDEGSVLALVPNASPLHDAEVERIRQHLGELGGRHRRSGPLGERRREAPRVHGRLQFENRVLAGRVKPECLPNQARPLVVELHLGHVPAGDLLSDVGVADGRPARPTTHLGFLGHALSDLAGQVGRVELGHERVDALHEPPRGRLLDVLGHRDQLHPRVAERRSDGHVVLHGTGEAIDLVDDDRADPALGHQAEKGPSASGGRRCGRTRRRR